MERYKPTVEWAKEVKQGCLVLIEGYKKDFKVSCPFCAIKDKYYDKGGVPCPWITFTGYSCNGTNYDDFSGEDKESFHGHTNQQNINRLRGWIVRCNNIIKKGD